MAQMTLEVFTFLHVTISLSNLFRCLVELFEGTKGEEPRESEREREQQRETEGKTDERAGHSGVLFCAVSGS